MLPEAFPVLDSIAAELTAAPGERIEVEGHTDASGNAGRNLLLSRSRAQSVREYLARRGIARSRLSVRGYGALRPIATNDTPAGRAENRRVELRRLAPVAPKPAATSARKQKRSAITSRPAPTHRSRR